MNNKLSPKPVLVVPKNADDRWKDWGWWVVGLAILWITATQAYQTHSPITVLIGLVAVGLCLPPSRNLIKVKLRFLPNGLITAVVVLFLLISLGVHSVGVSDDIRASKEASLQAESLKRIAAVKTARLADFTTNKNRILSDVQSKFDAGQIKDALAVANKYALVTFDPDLANLKRSAELALMREDIKDESKLSLERRVQIYTTLASENSAYPQKAVELKTQLDAERRVAEEERQRQVAHASSGYRMEDDQENRIGAAQMIAAAGYSCNSVDAMHKLLTKTGVRVNCNGYRYAYIINDEGGRWVVRLD